MCLKRKKNISFVFKSYQFMSFLLVKLSRLKLFFFPYKKTCFKSDPYIIELKMEKGDVSKRQ